MFQARPPVIWMLLRRQLLAKQTAGRNRPRQRRTLNGIVAVHAKGNFADCIQAGNRVARSGMHFKVVLMTTPTQRRGKAGLFRNQIVRAFADSTGQRGAAEILVFALRNQSRSSAPPFALSASPSIPASAATSSSVSAW